MFKLYYLYSEEKKNKETVPMMTFLISYAYKLIISEEQKNL